MGMPAWARNGRSALLRLGLLGGRLAVFLAQGEVGNLPAALAVAGVANPAAALCRFGRTMDGRGQSAGRQEAKRGFHDRLFTPRAGVMRKLSSRVPET